MSTVNRKLPARARRDYVRAEIAQRRIREFEQRVAQHKRAVADLESRGQHLGHARRMLKVHQDFLRIARDHLELPDRKRRPRRVSRS